MNWAEGQELLPTHDFNSLGTAPICVELYRSCTEPLQSAKAGHEMESSPLF